MTGRKAVGNVAHESREMIICATTNLGEESPILARAYGLGSTPANIRMNVVLNYEIGRSGVWDCPSAKTRAVTFIFTPVLAEGGRPDLDLTAAFPMRLKEFWRSS